jgi:hypothetical protein
MAKREITAKTERDLLPVTAYLPPEMVARIDVEGEAEDRRRGAMVRRLIDEALDAREEKTAAAK